MIVGWKNGRETSEVVSVLTLINHMEKKIAGARQSYDSLSEFTHPNWSGASGLFSEIDWEHHVTRFGKNANRTESTRQVAVNLLAASLELFCHSYNKISDEISQYLSELTSFAGP